MTSDHLIIEDFELPCRIGTTPEERMAPQTITLSIRIFFSLHSAAKTDRLAESVDYAEIINQIRKLISERDYNLIETVAEQVSNLVLQKRRVHAVETRARKKVFSDIQSVGACIFRSKDPKSIEPLKKTRRSKS